jgi:hypothetical protein
MSDFAVYATGLAITLLIAGGVIVTMIEFKKMYDSGKDSKDLARERDAKKPKPSKKQDITDEF